jgi:hypothetical protein
MAIEVSVGYVRLVGVWTRAWEERAAQGAPEREGEPMGGEGGMGAQGKCERGDLMGSGISGRSPPADSPCTTFADMTAKDTAVEHGWQLKRPQHTRGANLAKPTTT